MERKESKIDINLEHRLWAFRKQVWCEREKRDPWMDLGDCVNLYTPYFALRDSRSFYVPRVEVGMSSRRFRI